MGCGQIDTGNRFSLSRFPVTKVKELTFLEIALAFQPLGPAILVPVLDQGGQVGQQGRDLLASGALEIQLVTDFSVERLAQLFGEMEKLGSLELSRRQLKTNEGPGYQDKGEQEVVRLAM